MKKRIGRSLIVILLSCTIVFSSIPLDIYAIDSSDEDKPEQTANVLESDSNEEASDAAYELTAETTENFTEELVEEQNIQESRTISAQTETMYLSFSDVSELQTFCTTNSVDLNTLKIEGDTITVNADGLILLSCVESGFEGYTIKLNGLSGSGGNLTSSFEIGEYKNICFKGLGRSEKPFEGTILTTNNVTVIDLILDRPLFNSLDVSSAKLEGISNITISTAADSTIGFSDSIVGMDTDNKWANIVLELKAHFTQDGENKIYTYPGSCIGTMKNNSSLTLKKIKYSADENSLFTAKVTSDNGNAGIICNTLETESTLHITELEVDNSKDITITSKNASAGGLTGYMESRAYLYVGTTQKQTIGSNWLITGKNAGGLVGEAENAILDLNVEVNSTKIKTNIEGGGAGGFAGFYKLTDDTNKNVFKTFNLNDEKIAINNIVLDATATNSYIGGLFGVLDSEKEFSISGAEGEENSAIISSIAGIINKNNQYDLNSGTSYGGLIGQVKSEKSDMQLASLSINGNIAVTTNLNKGIAYFGGLIGIIGRPGADQANRNGAYVEFNNHIHTISNGCNNLTSSGQYFGGAVGGMFYDSVLNIAENATFLPLASNIKYGGGIVGITGRKSTVRLSGTTNLTSISFDTLSNVQNPGDSSNNRNTNGQIVGAQNASIIYAAKTWNFIRPSVLKEIDDIGNYGSVIRLGENIGQGSEILGTTGGLSEGLISQDSNHRTVFGSAAALNDGVINITSEDQFALLSIADQTYGDFEIYPEVTNGFIIGSSKLTKIELSKDIDLRNTGITGFQRDFYNGESNVFTGEFDGKDNTIILDIGQLYANKDQTGPGNGQIHGHSQIGLFSQANATIKNLTISGTINIYERTLNNNQKSSMAVGAVVALSTKDGSTFENVTTNITINCAGNGTESHIGGLIGLKKGTNSSVSINNCKGNAVISDNTTFGLHTVGGLIGTYTGGGEITVTGTKIYGNITGGSVANAKYGGLISVIKDNPATLHLNELTVDGQKIVNSATTSSGGFLGYEWNNTEVYFGNSDTFPVIQGDSAVTVNGNANVGGLVYRATGYWQINNLKLKKANIQNLNGDLGLLVCFGRKEAEENTNQIAQLLYIEETKHNGFDIDGSNVIVSSTGGYFDEWAVYTAKDATSITDNGNSIISIATDGKNDGTRIGIDPNESTSTGYQNRTTNNTEEWTTANPNARYYYDLDYIRKNINTNGYIDTSEELVLWSVLRYCGKIQNSSGNYIDTNIRQYFETDDIKKSIIGSGNDSFDLTGYSYYPVNLDSEDVTINKCAILFANQIIESAEVITGIGLDTLNRKTNGTQQNHTQHYLMHYGLILNYRNTSTNTISVTLSVIDVTLQGTVGKGLNETGSGAIICGTVGGSGIGGSHFANVKLNGVFLDGLKVNSETTVDDYAPLLINTVGSYAGIDVQKISTTSKYSSSDKAATSLIGNVGDNDATNISLAFSNGIDLSGKTSESIFSHATLLESFRFNGASSSGYYHFNENEKFTYGREINGSVENENLQLNYFDTGNQVKDGENTNFNKEYYLPYVCQTKVTDSNRANTFHELEINIVKPDLTNGCGTYDDPYIIDQPAQLQLAAQYIARNSASTGWKINMVTDKEKPEFEYNNNHKTYTFGNDVWTSEDASCQQSEMRDYLRNAYYKINSDLQLSKFEGIGTTTYPFRGVVDGSNYTVTINAEKISSGFINVSYGSVVQNLNIIYTGTKEMINTNLEQNSNAVPKLNCNAVANESYFGGIIGDVKGGDNLIRKVSVVFKDVENAEDNFRITVYNHLQCVGGFLGIVEGGGVIFSEMSTTEGLKDTQIDTTLNETNKAYISPLVGRVLDGFVVNESANTGTAFEAKAGSDKNYSIGNILSTASLDINVSSSNLKVEINKEEELLLLSAIINSGACNGGKSLAYKTGTDGNAFKTDSGKVRNADYSHIGNVNQTNKSQTFVASLKDDNDYPSAENLPYVINKYAGNRTEFWDLCSDTPNRYLELSIKKDLDMSSYKNGYRAIGGRYNCTASSSIIKDSTKKNQINDSKFEYNTPVFIGIDGENHKLTLNNQIYGYSDDNYVANAAGGLINILRRKANTEVNIQNLTVSGYVKLQDFVDSTSNSVTNASSRRYAASVGGVIGRYFTEEKIATDITYLKLTKLVADNLTLYSDGATGGIIGQTGMKRFYVFSDSSFQYASGVTYEDCSYINLNATSCQSTGGLAGAIGDNANWLSGTSEASGGNKIINRIITNTANTTGKNSNLNVYAVGRIESNGLGGLIGNVGTNLSINEGGTYVLSLDGVNLQDKSMTTTGVSRTGGAIGFLHRGITNAYNIQISNSNLGNGKEDNLGGIVGCWFSNSQGGILENISIDTCELDAELSVGGAIGYISNAKKIKNITVKNTIIKQNKNDTSRGIGMIVGQISSGGMFGSNILLKDNSIVCTSTAAKGRLIGKVDRDVPIQILGVSVQYGYDKNENPIVVENQPKPDIGSFAYGDYSKKTNKVLIAYDAFLTEKTSGGELDQWPYVELPITVNGTTESETNSYKITGDTVKPYTIVGSATIDGIVKKNGNSYLYIGNQKTYQNVDDTKVDRLNSGIVSTYNANQDTTVPEDFNVVQIDGSAACLKQYLNVATNGAYDTGIANGMAQVDIFRYQWDSEKREFRDVTKDKGIKQTLVCDNATGDFYATAEYDNQKNMFTLVQVTFTTTDNSFKRIYHIPVVVRRMLQVDAMVTMVSGSVFNASEMNTYNTHALASAGEDITGYLTFKYNSNLSGVEASYDWQSYMEAGANLLGYYKKTMDTGGSSLPAGTKITLIDCQQNQRQYHAEVTEEMVSNGEKVYLELFGDGKLSYKDSSENENIFCPVSLAELLDISAEPATEAQKADSSIVKWVRLDNADGATVKDKGGLHYRLYDSKNDSDISELYILEVRNMTPTENYFVVISIPQQESHMLTLIKDGGTPKGSMIWSDSESSAPPTEIHQLHRYTNQNGEYEIVNTNQSSEISFNYLNNYTQNLNDIISEPTPVSVSREDDYLKMQFDIVNEISFNAENYEVTDPLYQELYVSLRKAVDSKETEMFLPSDATAQIDLYTYYLDEGGNKVYFKENDGVLERTYTEEPVASYECVAGTDGKMALPFALLKDGVYKYLDLSPVRQAAKNKFYIEAKARDGLTIGMSSVISNELLPSRDGESQNQTHLQFTSRLSFKENGLSYSTLRGSKEGKIGYYFSEIRQAVLQLDYLNVDQLGINLSDTYSGVIDTMLMLDFSEYEGFNSSLADFKTLNEIDVIEFTFSLKQKGNEDGVINSQSVKYGDVDINTYLKNICITGQNDNLSSSLRLVKTNENYPYYNETVGVFSIPITFTVNTELQNLLFSNYRIYVSVAAYKGDNPVELSVNTEKAFITYTLAKINTGGYWEQN